MNLDFDRHLGSVERFAATTERDGNTACSVTLSRNFPGAIDNLWDAVTSSSRISRWFLPVSGKLRADGRFQLKGNAGGLMTACKPRVRFSLTWEFGGDVSWVEVHFRDSIGQALLTLTHTALRSEHWSRYGPGATGVGWEMGFLGLAIHLAQPAAPKLDETAFAASKDGRAFITASSRRWADAAIAAGSDPEPMAFG